MTTSTPVDTLRESYQMMNDHGRHFDATILPFTLSQPHSLH